MSFHAHHDHSPDSVALDVRDISAGYSGDRRAIHEVSFSVHHGERVALIGPNGAGKSTLFKAIAGLVPFTSGEISVCGEDCSHSHAFVGYVPQQNDIDWSFPVTVFDVVMMGFTREQRWWPWTTRTHTERTMRLLEQLSLSDFRNRQIGELSGGQRRRVFIARALAQQASVILMDEPFTGVDETATEEIMVTLEALRERGVTVILSTHDMLRAATDFDRVLLLRGCVIAYDRPDAVMRPEVLQQAFGGALRVFERDGESLIILDEANSVAV
jgi:ABC-type Mn2+/Zn2+ transport system ATPase subunit